MHIVTSNPVGADQARAIKQILEEEDVVKLIVFANKFTVAAKGKRECQGEGVQYPWDS